MKKTTSLLLVSMILVQLTAGFVLYLSRPEIIQPPRTEIIQDELIKHEPHVQCDYQVIDDEPIHHDYQTSKTTLQQERLEKPTPTPAVEEITAPTIVNKQPLTKPAVVTVKQHKIPVTATAYYKPLPNQKKYETGSYKKEIRLNGKGVKTSSGLPPAVGLIAAHPKKFPSGTKLYIHGYGHGTVRDTGAFGMNTIDLFMGEGDTGRLKCKEWGRKKVEVIVVEKNKPIKLAKK